MFFFQRQRLRPALVDLCVELFFMIVVVTQCRVDLSQRKVRMLKMNLLGTPAVRNVVERHLDDFHLCVVNPRHTPFIEANMNWRGRWHIKNVINLAGGWQAFNSKKQCKPRLYPFGKRTLRCRFEPGLNSGLMYSDPTAEQGTFFCPIGSAIFIHDRWSSQDLQRRALPRIANGHRHKGYKNCTAPTNRREFWRRTQRNALR